MEHSSSYPQDIRLEVGNVFKPLRFLRLFVSLSALTNTGCYCYAHFIVGQLRQKVTELVSDKVCGFEPRFILL